MLGDNPERSFLGGAKIPNVSVPLTYELLSSVEVGKVRVSLGECRTNKDTKYS